MLPGNADGDPDGTDPGSTTDDGDANADTGPSPSGEDDAGSQASGGDADGSQAASTNGGNDDAAGSDAATDPADGSGQNDASSQSSDGASTDGDAAAPGGGSSDGSDATTGGDAGNGADDGGTGTDQSDTASDQNDSGTGGDAQTDTTSGDDAPSANADDPSGDTPAAAAAAAGAATGTGQASAGGTTSGGTSSPAKAWMTWAGVAIYRRPDTSLAAYCYTSSHVSVDADGAPNAYGPNNIGLDYNANAMYPDKNWQSVLAADPSDPSKPFVQTSGPFKGYFVAMTSLLDRTKPNTDPTKFVDASNFPYIVFPAGFLRSPGTGDMGDLVLARTTDGRFTSVAIVADTGGGSQPLGEMSISLATRLGGHNPSPRGGNGAPTGPIQYLVFPGSRSNPPWPRTLADIEAKANDLLNRIGGWSEVAKWSG